MEQVFPGAPGLQRKQKVGDGECVALIQAYTKAGPTWRWRQGAAVLGNRTLRAGTAIATFEQGRWPLHHHRKHAAFFLRYDPEGFWVIDQYANRKYIESRLIKVKSEADQAKATYSPSNDAAMFYVIETP
ncbi:BPSL0067 family protein [Rugamonas sp. A1-17]|nr:BPSL0067 family protein [Rugamonas sp. A1-17]